VIGRKGKANRLDPPVSGSGRQTSRWALEGRRCGPRAVLGREAVVRAALERVWADGVTGCAGRLAGRVRRVGGFGLGVIDGLVLVRGF
jgi:hypothetical protein